MKLIMFCTIYSMKIKKKCFKNKVTPEAFWRKQVLKIRQHLKHSGEKSFKNKVTPRAF